MKGLFPTSIILELFNFPYIFGTFIAMVALNFILSPSINSVSAEKKKKMDYGPIILYTAISVLLFVYTIFCDKIF